MKQIKNHASDGIGASVLRLEDKRFLKGKGRFVDDIQLPRMLHAAVLRSPHAHAHIVDIDIQSALEMPGVTAVYTFADLPTDLKPIPVRLNPYGSLEPFLQYPLAENKVRYVGEPVALVIAESRYLAEDALDHIYVTYENLPVLVDVEAATKAVLFDTAPDNVASHFKMETGDVAAAFANADHVVESRFVVGRHSGVPLETRGLVAQVESGSGRLYVWGPTKVTHFNRGVLAKLLQMAEHQIRLIEPDVGGGFGVRGEFYPEDYLIPWAALKLERPIKWIEDRLEHLVACNHSRQQVYEMALALSDDGTILAVDVTLQNDHGGYIRTHGIIVPELAAAMFPGPYRIKNYRCKVRCLLSNKTPTGTYRAPGRFEAHSARERLLDIAAAKHGFDPVDLRLKNFIPPDEMPFAVGTHSLGEEIVYDSGNYAEALETVLQLSRYRERCQSQPEDQQVKRGLGIGCFIEKTGLGPFEGAKVEIDPTGHVLVSTGAASVGQGIETVLAQIAAEQLGLRTEQILVRHGDTDLLPFGIGSFASRATVMAGNAVYEAACRLQNKMLTLAAELLSTTPEKLSMEDGEVFVMADPKQRVHFAALAQASSPRNDRPDQLPGLAETHYFRCDHMTYAYGAVVAEVEVDLQTGAVCPTNLWIAYDVGTAVNPQLVVGQVEGGAVQGLGGALFEEFVYDEAGQLLSGTFADYLLPTMMEVPPMRSTRLEGYPSHLNPLGIKGAGEAGISGMGAALANAVGAALQDQGHRVTQMPLTPQQVWHWLSNDETTSQGSRTREVADEASTI